eukprot:30957-Pelagococcus_subviridis.AAC.18
MIQYAQAYPNHEKTATHSTRRRLREAFAGTTNVSTLHVRSLEPPSRASDTSQNVELIDDATRDAVLSRVVFRCGRASLSRDGWRYE